MSKPFLMMNMYRTTKHMNVMTSLKSGRVWCMSALWEILRNSMRMTRVKSVAAIGFTPLSETLLIAW